MGDLANPAASSTQLHKPTSHQDNYFLAQVRFLRTYIQLPKIFLSSFRRSGVITLLALTARRDHHHTTIFTMTNKTCFKKETQFKTDYSPSTITKYESQRTGMSAVVVDREGPKVLGFFALATEILDDSGSPHTLEHLCFMGSKNYKYKGVLDRMANRYISIIFCQTILGTNTNFKQSLLRHQRLDCHRPHSLYPRHCRVGRVCPDPPCLPRTHLTPYSLRQRLLHRGPPH